MRQQYNLNINKVNNFFPRYTKVAFVHFEIDSCNTYLLLVKTASGRFLSK